ncbi:protein kinase domain containing protein [Stylonychia lemnae]|uniref:Protein kinase domain containing protein n=1 Tax=Stylonychia lemnae TaxID=5949 RepID=A0A078AT36_STYLE|nr:protein kinase domain containing protein [Stylonychia lemnae]|eukprot:CDW85171.1 protein kinase domain containing protein [Stylonychia lemnae]
MQKYVALQVQPLWEKYQFEDNIDSGAFGSVKKVKNTEDGKFYAMKVQDIKKLMTRVPKNYGIEMVRILREINTFRLCHPNITQFKESYFTFEDQFAIVTELAESNLKTYIENTELSNAQIAGIMIQILKGTIHLHNQNIMHRDLSPDNILVFENGQKFKICDFGMAQLLSSSNTYVGKPYFKAPEIDLGTDFRYNSQVDIWSLGVILYYLCTKEYQYQSNSIAEIKKQDQEKIITLQDEQKIFEQLLNKMLQLDPALRIDAIQVLYELCIIGNEPLEKHLEIEEEKEYNHNPTSNVDVKSAFAQTIQSTNAIWKNNLKDGYGRQIYDIGSYYIGEFKNGKRNGYGKFYYKDGSIYEGQWVNDIKEGLGFYKWIKGDQYCGQWVNGQRKGVGVSTLKNGDIYLGQFINNLHHGIRLYIAKDDGQIEIRKYENNNLIETLLKIENAQK